MKAVRLYAAGDLRVEDITAPLDAERRRSADRRDGGRNLRFRPAQLPHRRLDQPVAFGGRSRVCRHCNGRRCGRCRPGRWRLRGGGFARHLRRLRRLPGRAAERLRETRLRWRSVRRRLCRGGRAARLSARQGACRRRSCGPRHGRTAGRGAACGEANGRAGGGAGADCRLWPDRRSRGSAAFRET